MGISGQKGRFWTIFGQKGAIFEFSVKKQKRHFLLMFFSFFNTKNQKILMRRFSGKLARTDKRTYGGESKGSSTPSRDQKGNYIFYEYEHIVENATLVTQQHSVSAGIWME